MDSHGLMIGLRLLLALAVGVALPISHHWWGDSPEAAGIEGQAAFAFSLLFAAIGMAVASAFFAITTLAHFILRHRMRIVPWIDAGLALTLLAMLVLAGVTATYSTTP